MNIAATIKEIENKYKIIKRIDFNKDLDLEKSGKFYIDKSRGCIEFLYTVSDIIEPSVYNLIYGEMNTIGEEVRLVPTFNDMTDNKVKRAQLLLERKINPSDFIVFDIKVKLNANTYFFVTLNNYYSYELLKAQKEKKVFLAGDYYQSKRRKVMYFTLDANMTMIEYEGLNQSYSHSVPVKNSDYQDEISIIFNFANGSIRFGENKMHFQPSNIIKHDEPIYISLVCNSKTNADCDMETYVKRIVCGTADNGYLYFKPIAAVMDMQVFVISKGSPTIEYYSNSLNKWLTINNGSLIKADGKEVMLRARLSTADKIYQILITQNEEN